MCRGPAAAVYACLKDAQARGEVRVGEVGANRELFCSLDSARCDGNASAHVWFEQWQPAGTKPTTKFSLQIYEENGGWLFSLALGPHEKRFRASGPAATSKGGERREVELGGTGKPRGGPPWVEEILAFWRGSPQARRLLLADFAYRANHLEEVMRHWARSGTSRGCFARPALTPGQKAEWRQELQQERREALEVLSEFPAVRAELVAKLPCLNKL
ncbi:MAG: hypothetical protein AAGA56_17675 [Myxococcota bacterium]